VSSRAPSPCMALPPPAGSRKRRTVSGTPFAIAKLAADSVRATCSAAWNEREHSAYARLWTWGDGARAWSRSSSRPCCRAAPVIDGDGLDEHDSSTWRCRRGHARALRHRAEALQHRDGRGHKRRSISAPRERGMRTRRHPSLSHLETARPRSDPNCVRQPNSQPRQLGFTHVAPGGWDHGGDRLAQGPARRHTEPGARGHAMSRSNRACVEQWLPLLARGASTRSARSNGNRRERARRNARNWLGEPGPVRSDFVTKLMDRVKALRGPARSERQALASQRIDRVRVDGPIRRHSPLVVTALAMCLMRNDLPSRPG